MFKSLRCRAVAFWENASFFMENYGANIAGWFWNTGNFVQLGMGVATLTPREWISALINISSSSAAQFYGHKSWGVPTASALGIAGTFLAVYPGLVNGEASTVGGFIAFVGFQCFGLFGTLLVQKFGANSHSWLRNTLGHPRRIMGLMTFFLARVPIIYGSITHGRWDTAGLFAIWGMGDLAASLSKPKLPILKPQLRLD